MEIYIAIAVTINLLATLILFRERTTTVEIIHLPVAEIEEQSTPEEFTEQVVSVLQAETPSPAPENSTSAWVNRQNIPWNAANQKPAEPPAKKPDGYGFVR